jgi:subtilisin family serine protease
LQPSYPASYPEAAIVGVGATDARGRRAAFSNRGPGVDVTAPGDDILSLGSPGFAYRSGTSMAAAYVSATLALEAAAAPGVPTSTLRDALLGSLRPGLRLDAARAVQAVRPKATQAHHRRARHRATRRAARRAARR